MIKLFAVINGEVIEDLEENTTPTYTRIHYLLNELENFEDMEVISISFHLRPKKGLVSILCNNMLKAAVALRSALTLVLFRPFVYFAYPHSLTTVQNRAIFWLCRMIDLIIILDIHDTVEQANAVGTGRSKLNEVYEGYCFRESTLLLPSMDGPLWRRLLEAYEIPEDKHIVYVPNAFEDEFIQYYPEPYKSQCNRFNVCYIGAITKNRGIELLVQACSDLHRRYPWLRLLLLGTYGEGISEQTSHLISESDFITLKEIPRRDIPRSFADIDLFVMPYNPLEIYMNSITPTKFFEYIGTGKPIISTKCESIRDIGSDGSIMYVDYEIVDFERKMERLICSPKLREEMSIKLLAIREKHTWKERADRIYKELSR
ncbi:MAG: glycosyltransferase family 4 protein [Methanothrix sp.]